jgi:hypothetical protein
VSRHWTLSLQVIQQRVHLDNQQSRYHIQGSIYVSSSRYNFYWETGYSQTVHSTLRWALLHVTKKGRLHRILVSSR